MRPARGVRYHQPAREEVFAFILMKVGMFRLSDHLERILSPSRPENMPVLWMSVHPNHNKQQIKMRLKSTFPFVRLRVEREASIMDLL